MRTGSAASFLAKYEQSVENKFRTDRKGTSGPYPFGSKQRVLLVRRSSNLAGELCYDTANAPDRIAIASIGSARPRPGAVHLNVEMFSHLEESKHRCIVVVKRITRVSFAMMGICVRGFVVFAPFSNEDFGWGSL
ncbi:hypothetical protein Trydic_g8776 [Trypoxylus dichotomus]